MAKKIKKRAIERPPAEKIVSVHLCPGKIAVVTGNVMSEGDTRYMTNNLTLLPTDVDDLTLGETVALHIQQSEYLPLELEILKSYWEYFKKKLQFKTDYYVCKNAKWVTINLTGKHFIFESYQAVLYERMFLGNPKTVVQLSATAKLEDIGKQVRLSWKKCKAAYTIDKL